MVNIGEKIECYFLSKIRRLLALVRFDVGDDGDRVLGIGPPIGHWIIKQQVRQ